MVNVSKMSRFWISFGRQWGLPILFGATSGLLSIVVTLDALVASLGSVFGGMLASLSGIGLGLLLSVFATLMIRLMWPLRAANLNSVAAGH